MQQMAADVANGTGRPWTPPWDPGDEFGPDDEPWKAEFWTYTEAVPSPLGGEGYVYQMGLTYDLAELRSSREKSAHAGEVWEEDVRKQTATYWARKRQSADDSEPGLGARLNDPGTWGVGESDVDDGDDGSEEVRGP